MVYRIEDSWIRVCDDLNPWIDALYLIKNMCNLEEAYHIIEKSMDMFWSEDNPECYGNIIEKGLSGKNVSYEAFYLENEEGDCLNPEIYLSSSGKMKTISIYGGKEVVQDGGFKAVCTCEKCR